MGKLVLIAEDEPHLVESLTFILGREGFELATAFDGETALQKIWTLQPDLVVLDVMLPKASGFDILKKIRANTVLRSLPVIILTAKGQKQDRATAEEIGADVFLTKPFSNKEVVAAVKRLIGS